MNELLAKFRQLDARIRTIGLGVLLLIVFVSDFFFLIRPQFNQFVKIGKDSKEISETIDSTIKNVERARFLRAEVESAKKNIVILQDRVMSKDSMTAILERIALLASQSGVNIKRIAPDVRDFKVLLDKNGKKYLQLSVSLQAEAGYHDFGRFIGKIENDVLFIRMDQFSIAGSSMGIHKIEMNLKAMMFEGEKIVLDQEMNAQENVAQQSGEGGSVFEEKFPGVPVDATANMKILDKKAF